jgi:hypothetical protein
LVGKGISETAVFNELSKIRTGATIPITGDLASEIGSPRKCGRC